MCQRGGSHRTRPNVVPVVSATTNNLSIGSFYRLLSFSNLITTSKTWKPSCGESVSWEKTQIRVSSQWWKVGSECVVDHTDMVFPPPVSRGQQGNAGPRPRSGDTATHWILEDYSPRLYVYFPYLLEMWFIQSLTFCCTKCHKMPFWGENLVTSHQTGL